MLREIMNIKFTYLLLGVVFGSSFHFTVNQDTDFNLDYLLYLFPLQGLAIPFLKVESVEHLVFSIVHFSLFLLLLGWVINKKPSIKQWIFIICGYAVFSFLINNLLTYILLSKIPPPPNAK